MNASEDEIKKACDFAAATEFIENLPQSFETTIGENAIKLSGGQKQRTALGRTLASEPKVFLLDEPISHLDAKIRAELRSQFHNLEALREVSTVYVTHDHGEAFAIADEVLVLNQGKVEDSGSVEQIKNSDNKFVKYFLEY